MLVRCLLEVSSQTTISSHFFNSLTKSLEYPWLDQLFLYNLHALTFATMIARQSVAQRRRQAIANGVSKSWAGVIIRTNRAPRGLFNGGNTCYKNAVLQNLLHLPRFVNWIMQHNQPRQAWPCQHGDPNRYPPAEWLNEAKVAEHYTSSVTSAEDPSRKFFCDDDGITHWTVPLAGTAGLTNV